MNEKTTTINLNGKEVKISLGKIGVQSAGSVMLTVGGTTLYATASVDRNSTELDYFPLSIEYIEKMYARGVMSGSKYKKREGLPSDEAIIKARQVDHSIRSLFPKSFKKPVAVVLTVLAFDGVNDPETLGVLGASLALIQTGIPFFGPCSSVIACVGDNDEIIINPDLHNREKYRAEYVVSGLEGKILNLEGWSKEITDETMDKLLDESMKVIEEVNKQQSEFMADAPKGLKIDWAEYNDKAGGEELIDLISEKYHDEIHSALFIGEKIERNAVLADLKDKVTSELTTENAELDKFNIMLALEYVQRKVLREGIMKENKRVSGRGLDQLREIAAEIDVLPTVHGSALFNRGLTQALSIVTLGPKSDELMIDDMEGESSKTFMHHYNMPAYANGEAGRFNYHPGRREIGHGAIGENALKNMIPDTDSFPYTIRVVSEITSSNGSTSMAATCASSMALMAAGVPLKEPVAGIGVGLVTEDGNEDNYKLLLDIEGIEDFYGDMDFKVCGTKNGITAIQYENKLRGVPLKIMKETLRLAGNGRMQILEKMNSVISTHASQLAENAPKVITLNIPVDKIGELIGPGGKNIKALVASVDEEGKSSADVKIEEDGTVTISAYSQKQLDTLKQRIEGMFEVAKVGNIYEGEVDKVMNFGAFVNVFDSGITGLLHVSEISDKFVKDANEVIKPGQRVKVKVIKVADGKTSFTLKGVPQD